MSSLLQIGFYFVVLNLLGLNFKYSIILYHFDVCVQVPVSELQKSIWDHFSINRLKERQSAPSNSSNGSSISNIRKYILEKALISVWAQPSFPISHSKKKKKIGKRILLNEDQNSLTYFGGRTLSKCKSGPAFPSCSALNGSHALGFPKVLAQIWHWTATCMPPSVQLEGKREDPS